MSIQYGNQHVDERYAKYCEPNLFHNTFLFPGITYNDKVVEGPAGGLFIHKLNQTQIAPQTPGRDFNNTDVGDSLIPFTINNLYQRARKVYNVAINAVDAALAEENLAAATGECKEGRELSALACLLTEGTNATPGTASTASTIIANITKARTAIRNAKGVPDVMICTPEIFGLIKQAAMNMYTPVKNDMIVNDAGIGMMNYLGLTIIEFSGFGTTTAPTYYNHAGTLCTALLTGTPSTNNAASLLGKYEFVMYDHRAFYLGDNVSTFRIVDGAPIWNGIGAQVEINSGMRVSDANRVYAVAHT